MNDEDIIEVEHGDASRSPIIGVPVIITLDFIEMPSISEDSQQNQPCLHIHVLYLNNDIEVQAPESLTVGSLKTIVYSATGVPPCQQEFTGWLEEPMSDAIPLSTLNTPNILFLRLNQREGDTVIGDQYGDSLMEVVDNSETIYILKIYDEFKNKEYNLKLPGGKNVAQVKAVTFTLTGIPVRHQIWHGWPEDITDESKLYELDLDQPFQCLTVQSSNNIEERSLNNSVIFISNNETPPSQIIVDLADTVSISEDFEESSEGFSGEEEMFNDFNLHTYTSTPLIPDNVFDETAGFVHFMAENNQDYFCPVWENERLAVESQLLEQSSDDNEVIVNK